MSTVEINFLTESELQRLAAKNKITKKERKAQRNRILLKYLTNKYPNTTQEYIYRSYIDALKAGERLTPSLRPLFKKQVIRPKHIESHVNTLDTIKTLKNDLILYRMLKTYSKLHGIYNEYYYNKLAIDSALVSYIKGTKNIEASRASLKENIGELRRKIKFDKCHSDIIKNPQYTTGLNFDYLQVPLTKRGRYAHLFRKYLKNISHKPTKLQKYFGVEIECIFPNENAVEKFTRVLVDVPYVTISTDGSLRKENGANVCHEIKVLTDQSFTTLKQVCDALKQVKAFVNKSCGLHIHLDWREQHIGIAERTIKGRLNQSLLGLMAMLVPNTRRTNKYCVKRVSYEKYSYVNLSTKDRLNTIEVRLHSGTTDFEKISNWIKIWSYLLYTRRLKPFDVNSLNSFLNSIPYQSVGEFYKKRAILFNSKDVLAAHGITQDQTINNNNIEFNESDEICVNF